MRITDFLAPERIFLDVRVRTKAQLVAEIARNAARLDPTVGALAVETALLAREQLGSTGLGAGFAMPHARIEGLQAYQGMFLSLHKPIAFEAIDGSPVSMVFVLLIPSGETASHVSALAAISRMFRDAATVNDLRRATTAGQAYEIFARQ